MIRNEIKVGDIWTRRPPKGKEGELPLWRWLVIEITKPTAADNDTWEIQTVDFNYEDYPNNTVKSRWIVGGVQIRRGDYILLSRLDDNK